MTAAPPLVKVDAVIAAIQRLAGEKARCFVAIDGRCAAGKTALAREIADAMPCNVICMDDFYLPFDQRTEALNKTPGGNMDFERMRQEVVHPLMLGFPFNYRAYACKIDALLQPRQVEPCAINVIEGMYAMHPSLGMAYDLKIFMEVEPALQRKRILEREGKALAQTFFQRWIPMGDRYFESFRILERCDFQCIFP